MRIAPFRLRRAWPILGLLAFGMAASVEAADVVVHAEVDEQAISQADLRAIFTLRRRAWGDGAPVKIFVLPDTDAAHQRFTKQQLRLYPYQLRQIWDRAVFSGTGAAPELVRNAEEMLEAVGRTPGGIGYVEGGELPATVRRVETTP